ncbi:hypothetical protein BJV74DRAFT_75053 [Russula compacta]|nr:hypothetical protein BJV74DRAFT_75053 [Russula compacta]
MNVLRMASVSFISLRESLAIDAQGRCVSVSGWHFPGLHRESGGLGFRKELVFLPSPIVRLSLPLETVNVSLFHHLSSPLSLALSPVHMRWGPINRASPPITLALGKSDTRNITSLNSIPPPPHLTNALHIGLLAKIANYLPDLLVSAAASVIPDSAMARHSIFSVHPDTSQH